MNQRYRGRTFVSRGDHDELQSSSENGGADSPLSGDDSRAATASTATPAALSPKKGRRSIQKRVVSVQIGDVEGSNRSNSSKGEAYPPSDSWAWRKYGQKPIKGSPYPRGYYRCSSSKGCPARKQVERSRVDPTTLVITYACEHNHPVPTSRHPNHNHHHHSSAAPAAPTSPLAPEEPPNDEDEDVAGAAEVDELPSEERKELLTCAAELGLGDAVLMEFAWLSDGVKEAPSFVGPRWDDTDVSVTLPVGVMREDEESLFADLDELPECSAVFRRGRGISTCQMTPAVPPPLCSTTG